MREATDRQKRAIKVLVMKYPDTVKPILGDKSIDSLMFEDARRIMDAVEAKHGDYKKRQQDEQQQDQQQNEQKNDDKEHKDRMRREGFRPGSKQEVLANALRQNDLDPTKTLAAVADQIGKTPALTFTKNENQRRIPLPVGGLADDSQTETQFGRCLKTIYAVRRALINGGERGHGGEKQKQEKEQQHEQKQENKEQRENREAVELLTWIRSVRKFCQDRAADGHPLDEIGLRPVEYGAKMLTAGIPLTAIKHALTMHYPSESRRALGVRDYDVQGFHTQEREEGIHAALPYCLALIEHRIPVALVGPKGTGKTTLARQIAEYLTKKWDREVPFGMVSMTSGTSPSAFNGRPMVADDGTQALIMALCGMAEVADDQGLAEQFATEALDIARQRAAKGDTVMSQFVRIYKFGGVFLFDEMDAADENLLLGVNSALANGFFANPATGEIIKQHKDFIAMAGMNTLGLGSGRDYTSRNRLDAATLDRWNAGRVQITLDSRIEEKMFWDIINGNNG